MDFNIGKIKEIDIEQTMRDAYLDYAMSVIVARALPDVRDGLKPVQRRILYAMYSTGLKHNTPYRKSARIVGEVLGKYHPHGDAAVYDALARMAQDFSLRYPLVDGQGNFGSIDGDSPAAMRYTEARLSAIAEELLEDIDKETVDFVPNFDGSLEEPSVLPGKVPNLLVNGASGIAVGMATNIPPHNINEIADAVTFMIDKWHELDQVSVDDLLQIVPGPDFPTGALIVGHEGVRNAYATGRGRIIVRGEAEIETLPGGKNRIVISSIPYQVNKSQLVERIAKLARSGRIPQISDLRDESDRSGLRIVVDLKKGSPARKILNQLYKFTPLETTFGANMLALVDGIPRLLSLKKALQEFIKHRENVLERRTRYELRKAKERSHILEGLLKALQFLDEVISIIRNSPSAEEAKTRLMSRLSLTEIQAQAILDMQLRRLAALERQKIEEEYKELQERIAYLESLLENPDAILALIREEMGELKEKYGDERRTRIIEAEGELTEEDLIPQERILVTLTRGMYIKRTPARSYRAQGRGGRGVQAMDTREDDQLEHMVFARTLDHMLFFTSKGRVFSLRGYQIPEGRRTARGTPIINLLNIDPDERITAVVPISDFGKAEYIFMATRKGTVKRLDLSEFEKVRPSGLIALKLRQGDSLLGAIPTSGNDDIILVSGNGRALRFHEKEVRVMGRAAAGVRGMRLGKNDELVGMSVVEPNGYLLVITKNGFGKRTPVEEYTPHSRGTQGVYTTSPKYLDKIGTIAVAHVVQEEDEIAVLSAAGISIRLKVSQIRPMSRGSKGVKVISLQQGDYVVAAARIKPEPKEPENESEES